MINSRWYQFWALFKVLRWFQFDRIREILVRSALILDDIFITKKVLILNMRIIAWVAIKFIGITHFIVCVWILVTNERIEEGASERLELLEPNQIYWICFDYYVVSLYFVVMTQTTVGYGVPYSYTLNNLEMIFIMIIQFSGIGLFSVIVNEVFSYKSETKVEDMV